MLGKGPFQVLVQIVHRISRLASAMTVHVALKKVMVSELGGHRQVQEVANGRHRADLPVVNAGAPSGEASNEALTNVAVVGADAPQIAERGFKSNGSSVALALSLCGLEDIPCHDRGNAVIHDDPVGARQGAPGLDADWSGVTPADEFADVGLVIEDVPHSSG